MNDVTKALVTIHDIVKSKDFVEEQINLIKDLASKITILEEKVNFSEASFSRLNAKLATLEEI